MLTASANIETDRGRRYLAQLCRHFSSLRRHDSRRQAPPPAELKVRVEWSNTRGTVVFEWGRCMMQATSHALILDVEASDEHGLARIQDLVGGHVARFGERDRLQVNWVRVRRQP